MRSRIMHRKHWTQHTLITFSKCFSLLLLWQWLVLKCILCSFSSKLFWFSSLSQAFFFFFLSQSYSRSSLKLWVLRANRKPMGHGNFLPFLWYLFYQEGNIFNVLSGGSQLLDSKDASFEDPSNFLISTHPSGSNASFWIPTPCYFSQSTAFPLFSYRMWGCSLHDPLQGKPTKSDS